MEGHGDSVRETRLEPEHGKLQSHLLFFNIYLRERESLVIRTTKLKDIQACSGKSVKGTMMTATNSLSIRGLAYCSARKAF